MKKYSATAKAFILGLFLSLGVGIIFAEWQDPTEPFPDGNTPAPINVGTESQTKSGSLWASFLGSDGAGYIDGNFEVGNTITIGGGDPKTGRILSSTNDAGLAGWIIPPGLACIRRTQSAPSQMSSSPQNLTVNCLAGEKATGGGGICVSGYNIASNPNSSLSSWAFTCSASGGVTVYAVCCQVSSLGFAP